LRFEIAVRIPRWCQNPTITINGKKSFDDVTYIGSLQPGVYSDIIRDWKPGDRVDIDLPMEWRFVLGRERQAGRVAVMRGPVLFCLDPLRKENAEFNRLLLKLCETYEPAALPRTALPRAGIKPKAA
jgi:DUF1680 family protein